MWVPLGLQDGLASSLQQLREKDPSLLLETPTSCVPLGRQLQVPGSPAYLHLLQEGIMMALKSSSSSDTPANSF